MSIAMLSFIALGSSIRITSVPLSQQQYLRNSEGAVPSVSTSLMLVRSMLLLVSVC